MGAEAPSRILWNALLLHLEQHILCPTGATKTVLSKVCHLCRDKKMNLLIRCHLFHKVYEANGALDVAQRPEVCTRAVFSPEPPPQSVPSPQWQGGHTARAFAIVVRSLFPQQPQAQAILPAIPVDVHSPCHRRDP